MTNQPPDQNFWNTVDEESEKTFESSQFGQLTIKPSRYMQWVNGQPTDVTPEVFAQLPAADKSLELMFSIDVKGMNPKLDWAYERKMLLNTKAWSKILKPSIEALLGEDSMQKGAYSTTLQELSGKFVEAHDVPDPKNPEYNTIKLVQIFADKNECFAAYTERFGDSANAGGTAGAVAAPATAPLSVPPNYTAETWASVTPNIKAALETQSVPDVAVQYQVDVPFIAEIAGQA